MRLMTLSRQLLLRLLCVFLACHCSQHGASQTTKGKDFWFGYMDNIVSSVETVPLEVYVSSERVTSGTITIPGLGFTQTFNVNSNSTTSISIPSNAAAADASDRVESKAIHIVTCDTVSVYAINKGRESSDATLIYPTPSLGSTYYAISRKGDDDHAGSQLLIVATENNSIIEITPSANTNGGHMASISYTIMLNQGQMYQIVSGSNFGSDPATDLTGTIIKSAGSSSSCFDFAVFSGNRSITIGQCNSRDHIYEQLPPINYWGKEFIVGNFEKKQGVIFRVLAKTNGTSLTIDNVPIITLNSGEFYDYSVNGFGRPLYIVASAPVMVMQYMAGRWCDAIGSDTGDPSQIIINPIEQDANKVLFYTISSSLVTEFYANVIAKTSNIANVKLNGIPITGYFSPVPGNPLYSYAQGIPLVANTHYQLTCDSGLCGIVYGIGVYESYAHTMNSYVKNSENDFSVTYPNAICPGETWHFRAVNDPNATSYDWDYGDGSIGSGLSSSHVYATEGSYSVTLTKTFSNTCPVKIIKWVAVKKISATITGNHTICQGQTTILSTKIKNDTVLVKTPTLCGDTIRQAFINRLDSVKWSTGSRSFPITVNPTTTTKYYLYAYSGSCVVKDSFIVNVINTYTSTIATETYSCLALGAATVTILGGSTPFSYTWSASASSGSIATNIPPGSQTLTIQDANGCVQSYSFTVIGTSTSTLSLSASSRTVYCGTSVTLTATGGTTYTWSTREYTPIIVVTPVSTSNYTVRANNSGCLSTQTITINVNQPAPISITGNTLTCFSSTVSLTGTGLGTYVWQGPGIVSGANTVSPVVNMPGNYTLTVTQINGCSYEAVAVVANLAQRAQADFQANPSSGTVPLVVQFTNNSNGASVFYWNFGDGQSSSQMNPEHTFLENGTYAVYLIAGIGLCADTTTITIITEQEFTFYAPNCITPNQDGVNDIFLPKGTGWDPDSFSLEVFNRWGELIFSTHQAYIGWDASYRGNGKLVKDGIYTWKVGLMDVNRKKHNFIGHVTLVK